MQQTTIAIDLAKSIFEVGISGRPGHVCEQHRLSRNQLPLFLANQPPSTILIGSLRFISSLGPTMSTFWARCEVTASFLCSTLCAPLEDGSCRRERHARSLAQQRYPPGSGQDGISATINRAASCSIYLDRYSHGENKCGSRYAA